jgi:hypothetical protein
MPQSETKQIWEIILGIAAISGVVLAAGSVKESRNWICTQTADNLNTPLFCDYDAKLSFRAFQYRNSADGVIAADACAPDSRVDTMLSEGENPAIVLGPNTALCWVLNTSHPDFEHAVTLPVHISVETPTPVYVNNLTGAITVTRDAGASNPVLVDQMHETQIVTLSDTPHLSLDPGNVSVVARRLILGQGDAQNWPKGHYRMTITSPLLTTAAPVTGSFELQ